VDQHRNARHHGPPTVVNDGEGEGVAHGFGVAKIERGGVAFGGLARRRESRRD